MKINQYKLCKANASQYTYIDQFGVGLQDTNSCAWHRLSLAS